MSGAALTVRVIGIGSPFGADRIGWQVADALERRLEEHGGLEHRDIDVHVGVADRPGVELLRLMQGAQRVILVDAVLDCDETRTGRDGTIGRPPRWLQRDELQVLSLGRSSHDLGVSEALALGEALGQLPEQLSILGIHVDPDPDVLDDTDAVEQGVEMILAALSTYRGEGCREFMVIA